MPTSRFDPESAGAPSAGEDPPVQGGPEAVHRLQAQLAELAEYVRLYLSARGDALLASVRALAVWLVIGLVALVAVVALLATAAAIALIGIAELVVVATGHTWAGYAIAGFGFLALCGGGLIAAAMLLRHRFRRTMVRKYARRHAQQRQRFGHDVAGQSAPRQA